MTTKKVSSFLGTSFTEGDVLEVTVKGRARFTEDSPWLALDAGETGSAQGSMVPLSGEGVTSVNRIEPPLAVGDQVRSASPSHCRGVIRAVVDGQAWVHWEHNNTDYVGVLSNFQRIK